MKNNKTEILTPFSNITNSSRKIKDWYGVEFAEILSLELDLPEKKDFVRTYKNTYSKLELKERLNFISELLDRHLEGIYKSKLKKLSALLGPEWPYETGMLNYGFHLYPVSQFVENNALKDIDASLSFINELTKRFTGEFAIRPIVNHDQKQALKTFKTWSKDCNFHLRRLSSEGLRARLPWGQPVSWVKEKPQKTIPILSSLRNDPVLYVRRSVANAMGDIIKLDEDLALSTFEKWLSNKHTKETLWVISHAIRHPIKKKNKRFVRFKDVLNKKSVSKSKL